MADTNTGMAAAANLKKRGRKPSNKAASNKKPKPSSDEPHDRRRRKPTKKFFKLIQKRVRDYNSDDDDQHHQESVTQPYDEVDLVSDDDEASSSGDELGGGGGGVTKFEQGCRAFRVAFLKIMSKKLPDDPLGPILSAHNKLVAAKLAGEVNDHKAKGDAYKEKRMAAEKGHVKPETYLDEKEKLLIKVATKGVVRLFNAVSKAQNPQKGLNPSRTKDSKVLAKERKQTFLTEMKKSNRGQKGQASSNSSKHTDKDEDEAGWAPLRDTYMLGSKLKDWDKMQASAAADERTELLLVGSDEE